MPTPLSPQSDSAPQPPTLHQPLRGLPGWLILLGVLTAVGSLSIDMYLPSFPTIVTSLHTDVGAVQRTLSMFFIGLALGQIVYGPLSDRFGRKPPLFFGMALYTLASLICALAPDISALQWGRLLQALGGCAGMVIPRATIRDRCDAIGTARAMSLVMLVMGAAPILAPQLGSWVALWFNWRAIFGLLVVFGSGCLIAIYLGMEETVDRATAPRLNLNSILRNYLELMFDRQFLMFCLCGGFCSSAMFAYIAISPFVLMELYKIPAHFYGWIFGANAFGLIAGSQINARLLAHYSPRQILAWAVCVPVIAGATLLILRLCGIAGLPILLPALFFLVGSIGFISPNTTALALQHQGARAGAAAALLGTLQLSIVVLSSTAISLWQASSELPLATAITVCGGGALLMFAIASHKQIAD